MSRNAPPTAVKNIRTTLEGAGCQPVALTQKEVWHWQQAWRERFAAKLHLETGKWIHRGFDWHTFAGGYHESVSGVRAWQAYSEAAPGPFLLVSDSSVGDFGFRCHGQPPGEALAINLDMLVMAESLSWSMAITHEPPIAWFAQARA